MIYKKFPFWEGDWKIFGLLGAGPLGGAQKSRKGAEDFDEFGKNVLEKFSKFVQAFFPIFPLNVP